MENDMLQAAITDRSPQSPPYKRHRPMRDASVPLDQCHLVIHRYASDTKPLVFARRSYPGGLFVPYNIPPNF
jgi:hypothetical protein